MADGESLCSGGEEGRQKVLGAAQKSRRQKRNFSLLPETPPAAWRPFPSASDRIPFCPTFVFSHGCRGLSEAEQAGIARPPFKWVCWHSDFAC